MDNFIPIGFMPGGGGSPTLPGLNQLPGGFSLDQVLDVGGDLWDWITGDDESSNGSASNGRVAAPATGGQTIGGCQVTVPVTQKTIMKAPRGYVVVTDPATGRKVGMLKGVATKCGLWKAPRKPPIKASDWRCLMKADSVVKKLDRIVSASNRVVGKKRMTRSSR